MRKCEIDQGVLALLVVGLLQGCPAVLRAAPGVDQATFATPKEGVEALIKACERHDMTTLRKIFGPEGKDIVESGDLRQDKEGRMRFAKLAREKNRLLEDPMNPDRVVLSIGPEEWPFPVPLIREAARWRFGTSEGRQEILARRIGDNEMNAIEIARGYVEAQMEYAQTHRHKGVPVYAQKIVSSHGKDDGLYWEAAPGLPPCHIPKGFAKAAAGMASADRAPYRGYFFKVLKAQGASAKGGAVSYVVNGEMIGGFALVAWPAEYGVSGIQTFTINHDDDIYEKNLGPETTTYASDMTDYNPDSSWRPVQSE